LSQSSDIQRMFGLIVPSYDMLNRLLSLGRDRAWRAELARSLDEPAFCKGLDLCCGTGDAASALLKRGKSLELLVAADFALPMCLAARDKLCRSPGPAPVSLACADSLELPFADRSFDFVSVAFGVRNFDNFCRGLCEIARVTAPGGKVAILEFAPPEGLLLNLLYRPYLKIALPLAGRLLAKAEGAYCYLSTSIESFLSPEAMLQALAGAGFRDLAAKKLTLGVTWLYTARR
jgi:demethylmenaquinone methyltransferase/2-methoxy-6-polyprenyl-1,4-benzoquinol methylase